MATGLEFVIGTYDEFILGYKVVKLDKDDSTKFKFVQTFAQHSHKSSIRCLSAGGNYLASGGADDRICIYDLKNRISVDELLHHNGTVNTLKFVPDGSYLLSGGADGKMTAISTKNWRVEKEWEKAHKGSVNFITMHPTGKLAMSIGADLTLRTWNLINGRQIYVTNLKNRQSLGGMVDSVEWSPNGSYFAIIGSRVIEIWSVDTGKITRTEKVDVKPVCLAWISEDELIVGLENGKLFSFNLSDDETQYIEAHEERVKSIAYLDNFLLTASSAGQILLWELINDRTCLDPRAEIHIGCRPICTLIIESEKNGFNINIQQSVTEQEKLLNKEELKVAKKISTVGTVTVEYENDANKSENKTKKKNKNKKNKSATETSLLEADKTAGEALVTDVVKTKKASPSPKKSKKNSQSLIIQTPVKRKHRNDGNSTDINIKMGVSVSAKKSKSSKRRSVS